MPEEKVQVRLHDGSAIDVEVHGEGPTVLLPVNPVPVEGPQAEELRRWGADPALGRSLIDGLGDAFRVVAFDYEGHVLQVPKPDTLTSANLAGDLLAVADAAGADRFAYYGYSWLAVAGLQLAIRGDRVTALAMGGWPPLDAPYAEMLKVTRATHELAMANAASPPPPTEPSGQAPEEIDWSQVELTLSEGQTRQFVTLYEALQDFDDRAADAIDYEERWGGVRVSVADPVIRHRAELEALGWQVEVLEGLDHLQAMQAARVLPILRPWLLAAV
jgi:pimeloyl-ACP methyl ester carboxylesterase